MIYPFTDFDRYGLNQQIAGKVPEKTFVILNNTSALHGHHHFGPNHVVSEICRQLTKLHIHPLGWANSWQGLSRLINSQTPPPTLVVLNGEGTLHHDNERAISLLAMAKEMKQRGSKVALVNSVWQANSLFSAEYLRHFDMVSVRESNSYEAIKHSRPDAQIIPDLGLASFPSESGPYPKDETWGIIDAAIPDVATTLWEFSRSKGASYFTMENRPRIFRKYFKLNNISRPIPPLLEENHLGKHAFWVTGRFHGALALLALSSPFSALHCNTFKMDGMLNDAGLSSVLLPAGWVQMPVNSKKDACENIFAGWDAHKKKLCSAYRSLAVEKSADFFARLTEITQ